MNRPLAIEQNSCERTKQICSPVQRIKFVFDDNTAKSREELDLLRQKLQGCCMADCGFAQYTKAQKKSAVNSNNLPKCFELYSQIAEELGSR